MGAYLLRVKTLARIRFPQYAWGVLVYMLFVVVWGAVVRASGSGDGCGKHWPFCGGHLIPAFQRLATLVEFSHRVSTGLILPLIGLLVVWAYRVFPRFHPVRLGVNLSLLFTLTEAAFGAILVLFGLVAGNESAARVVMMSLHLVNTFVLLMCLALTAWWSGGRPRFSFRHSGTLGLALGIGLIATLFLAVTGAITALSDTLYPANNLYAALQQDLNPGAHLIIRLRLLHPPIAIAVGIYSLFVARAAVRLRPTVDTQRFARYVVILFGINIAVGFLNVVTLTPIGMQLLHLLLADLLWIVMVLLSASTLAQRFYPSEDFDR